MVEEWLQQVIQAQQGDLAAFDRVVKHFHDRAMSYAYSRLGDFDAAEDATQEAFVEAFSCLKNLQQPGAFPTWFRKIIFKQCDRILRKKQLATVPMEWTIDLPYPGQTPLEAVIQQETQETIQAAINTLSGLERAIALLAYGNGNSLVEVGDILMIPVSTVKNRLHTARKLLQAQLRTKGEFCIMDQQVSSKPSYPLRPTDQLIAQINDFCAIVDCEAISVLGVTTELNAESKQNAYHIGKKYLHNGTMAYLADVVGQHAGTFFGVCTDVRGAGLLTYTIGVAGTRREPLPVGLPEDSQAIDCPAGRYARFRIVEDSTSNDMDKRMEAEGYFINGFRHDTPYVYDISRPAYHHYAADGTLLAMYQPIKIPQNVQERFESIRIEVVGLPTLRCVCSMLPMSSGNDVIGSYFAVQGQVHAVSGAQYHDQEYWGFPCEKDGTIYSCFGSRIIDFADMPDSVEHLTVPGGLCAHISQTEFNGDTPSLLYEVAFNHFQKLFLDVHPEYEFDDHRRVYARFRLGTSASIFVPIRRK